MSTAWISVRRNERGSWCVYLDDVFISDHATHTAARVAANNIARAEAAGSSGGDPQ